MKEQEFSTLCAKINGALDVRDVIDLLDYSSDKAIQSAGLWRLYCPIHQETVFRTLVINPRRNTYICEYSACPAHQPGDLIELLSRVRATPKVEIVLILLKKYGTEKLRLTVEQGKLLKAHSQKVLGKV